jgi:DNA polymerase-3 subunit delta
MVAIATREAERFVAAPPAGVAAFLVYGPDAGLVSERADAIALARARDQAVEQVRLHGDDIAADTGRLVDECHALSMFGDHRIIRLRLGSRVPGGLDVIVSEPNRSATLIVEAGDLKPLHAVRALFERQAGAAAVACYADDAGELARLLDDVITKAGVRLDPAARPVLLDNLGIDRMRSRAELEKLVLFAGPGGAIDLEAVENLLSDAAPPMVDTLIDQAMLGETGAIDDAMRRVLADGVDPGVVLGMALRHGLQLCALVRDARGPATPEAIKRQRFHWKRERTIRQQSELWTEQRLLRMIQSVQDAVLTVRRTPALAETIATRAFWSIALAATRSGQR